MNSNEFMFLLLYLLHLFLRRGAKTGKKEKSLTGVLHVSTVVFGVQRAAGTILHAYVLFSSQFRARHCPSFIDHVINPSQSLNPNCRFCEMNAGKDPWTY